MDQRAHPDAQATAGGHGGMNEADATALKIDLHRADDGWLIVIERDGQRRELGSLDELIRLLEQLASAHERRRRGLR